MNAPHEKAVVRLTSLSHGGGCGAWIGHEERKLKRGVRIGCFRKMLAFFASRRIETPHIFSYGSSHDGYF